MSTLSSFMQIYRRPASNAGQTDCSQLPLLFRGLRDSHMHTEAELDIEIEERDEPDALFTDGELGVLTGSPSFRCGR